MEKIRRDVLGDTITKYLRRAILLGELPDGHHLAEPDLAQQFGTSRSPVRESLLHLIREGFAERLPNGRVCVRHFTFQDIHNLFEFRFMLESQSIKKWIHHDQRALPEDEFKILLDKMQKSYISSEQFSEYDMEFHKKIVHLSNDKSMIQAWSGLEEVIKSILQITNQSNGRAESILEQHQNMISLLMNNSGYDEVCAVIKQHLNEAESVMVTRIKEIRKETLI
jgi:DNA-binding GntR family transcriptional regulator